MPGMTPRRPILPGLPGRIVAFLYGREIARRNRAFDRGHGVTRLDIPVISVGNLSVGGTGKTPMVVSLVEMIDELGGRACIAMRGYKAKGGISDEAEEFRSRLDVPVVAQADRIGGIRALRAREHIDAVVLDDGFQHRRLARDLDVVLIDATRSPLEDRLLPAGYLREPMASLARAHVVVITHAESAPVEAIEAKVREMAPEALVCEARHTWAGVFEGDEAHILSRLSGERTVVVCAIGNPGPFLQQAERACAQIVERIVLPDHDPYDARQVERIKRGAERTGATSILTTQKDWMKLRRETWSVPVLRPALEMVIERGRAELRAMVAEAIRSPS